MGSERVVVIGAGIGGLVAALDLARSGVEVVVLERAATAGGKIRQEVLAAKDLDAKDLRVDAGPTVFTMRHVFEKIFADAGTSLDAELTLRPLDILARHAWSSDERLDLFASIEQSADAIGRFAGPREADGYKAFCRRARDIYKALDASFIASEQPNVLALTRRVGLKGLAAFWRVNPFHALWRALGENFHDMRLRQLFGRYATYCGASPFAAPATLMLVAHVEQEGVWTVDGGMVRIAEALTRRATAHGAVFRYGAEATEILVAGGRAAGVKLAGGEALAADAVVVNGDAAALAAGLFGAAAAEALPRLPRVRSLSAMTWAMAATVEGFPLARHNVFFSRDYAAEFDAIFQRGRMPDDPTIYVCAQDRDGGMPLPQGPERLLVLANAPAIGDTHRFKPLEIEQCANRTVRQLIRCGLRVDLQSARMVATTPNEFAARFPATGGALYGQASHGWKASFNRPASRTRIPGLYLAGGSTHPGPGLPMAAISGRLAAAATMAAFASTAPSRPGAMPGGTSTR